MIRRLKLLHRRLTKPEPSLLRLSEDAAKRHSKIVHGARIALPVVTLGLVFAFALSTSPAAVDEGFVEQFAYLDKPTRDLQMNQPRYSGQDKKGRLYEISADKARQNINNPDLVFLDSLNGIRSPNGKNQMEVTADTGLYRTDARQLDLETNVELRRGIGGQDYVVTTNAAKVELSDRTLVSEAGITGASKNGSFIAEKMTVYQDEGKVVLEDVRMRFERKDHAAENDVAPAGKSE
jgi:lipopolysaccharide export system protein LptC